MNPKLLLKLGARLWRDPAGFGHSGVCRGKRRSGRRARPGSFWGAHGWEGRKRVADRGRGAGRGYSAGGGGPLSWVVTEKDDLLKDTARICRELGLTHYHLGGQPSRLRTEYLASRLREGTQAPLQVIAFVDYDEGGWTIGKAVVKQLLALGVTVERLDFLLREEYFTPEEVRLYAHPCKSKTKALRTLARLWVESGGGIRGEALGIHASHVKPFKRVQKLFLDLLAGKKFDTPPSICYLPGV